MKLRKGLIIGFGLGLGVVAAAPAYAANDKSFVSRSGNDANPCTQDAPCLTLQTAFNNTSVAGEIDCLDTANYLNLSINHSITINCVAAHATVQTVVIQPTGPSFNVILEGLDINGQLDNTGRGPATGINLASGGGGHIAIRHSRILANRFGATVATTSQTDTTIDLEDVDIDDIDSTTAAETGIQLIGAGTVHLNIRNSRIAAGGADGIVISGGGPVHLNIDNSEISHAANGLYLQAAVNGQQTGLLTLNVRNSRIVGTGTNAVRLTSASNATFENSEISDNNNAIVLFSPSGSQAITAVIRGTTVSNNSGYGIVAAGAGAEAVVTRSTISRNGTGVSAQSSGFVYSEGNNDLVLNTANGTFTGTVAPQ